MDWLVAGFWGAFFGTAALMMALSLAMFVRSRKRVALMAGLAALLSAGFAAAYLRGIPAEDGLQARLLAHVAVVATVAMALMLLSTLGMLRFSEVARRMVLWLALPGAAVIVAGWFLPPDEALGLGGLFAFVIGAVMDAVALRRAVTGDRLAWVTVTGVSFMLVGLAGLSWIALSDTEVPWPVHAVSATAGMVYLTVIAGALWQRYSYLLELTEVMAQGPSYDPVTRMPSHTETGHMLGNLFLQRDAEPRAVGVIAVCIANLYALENLHGRAAFNHALFITAGRLRRCVPGTVEMGRLGDDGFLLLARSPNDVRRLPQLARLVRERLSRPVAVSTCADPAQLDTHGTAWAAEVGIGVLSTSTQVRPSQVVTTARAMARTAWTYASRLACFDQSSGQIAELPAAEGAAA